MQASLTLLLTWLGAIAAHEHSRAGTIKQITFQVYPSQGEQLLDHQNLIKIIYFLVHVLDFYYRIDCLCRIKRGGARVFGPDSRSHRHVANQKSYG